MMKITHFAMVKIHK